MIKHIIRAASAVFIILVLSHCANMRAPTGGPKDIYAPRVIESDPPNYTTRFDSKKIILRFDEFVTVSDVVSEVFISPPLKNTPDIRTRGKSVIINIQEELLDSSTYSIFFGNSIKDITENNPIENYNYVFSTGNTLDSLSVVGEVINAFDLKPRGDVLVMLYEDNNDTIPFDSLPYFVKPSFLTRTNDAGFFVINNLRKGNFMLFALADINLSATFDQGDEEIAFLDSLISPVFLAPEKLDTALMDSLARMEEDSIAGLENTERQGHAILPDELEAEFTDSIPPDSMTDLAEAAVADSIAADTVPEDFFTLFMFKEVPDTVQQLLEADLVRQQVLRFIFRYPAEDVNITPLTDVPNEWMLKEWNEGMDTLRYYILGSEMDTISLRIWQDTTVFDTVSLSLGKEEIPVRKREREEENMLTVFTNISSPFPYFRDLKIMTGYPFMKTDFSRFLLVEGEDSLKPELEIFDQAARMIRLKHQLKENTAYTLFFPDSVLTDLIGRSNDSTTLMFSTNSKEDYGLYIIHAVNESVYDHLVIQLMTESGEVIREQGLQAEATIEWDLLEPGKYMIKAFADLNNNGSWDTGKYIDKRQPEPVVYYPGMLEVREAWSFEEDWEIRFE